MTSPTKPPHGMRPYPSAADVRPHGESQGEPARREAGAWRTRHLPGLYSRRERLLSTVLSERAKSLAKTLHLRAAAAANRVSPRLGHDTALHSGRPDKPCCHYICGRFRPGRRLALSDTTARPRTDTADLWHRWRTDGDMNARNALIINHASLVKWVANRIDLHAAVPADRSDLFGWGMLGLIDAIESFDPALGYAFPTWAVRRIKGAIIDELRRVDRMSRGARVRSRSIEQTTETLAQRLKRNPTHAELAAELGIEIDKLHAMLTEQANSLLPLDVSLADPPDLVNGVDHCIEQVLDREFMRYAVAALPDQQRTVIVLSYWEGLTLAEIGNILGVTDSRVCQIRIRALARLRDHLGQRQTVRG